MFLVKIMGIFSNKGSRLFGQVQRPEGKREDLGADKHILRDETT